MTAGVGSDWRAGLTKREAIGSPMKLWLLLGQSNANGLVDEDTHDAHLLASFPDVWFWPEGASAWEALGPGGNNDTGPELAFARAISRLPARNVNGVQPIGLLKQATSSTGLDNEWLPPSGSEVVALTAALTAADTALSTIGIDSFEVAGIIWIQGEEDANSDAASAAYQAREATLFDTIKGLVTVSDDFMVVNLKLPDFNVRTYKSVVNTAKDTNAGRDDVVTADVVGLKQKTDDLHYTAQSLGFIGEWAAFAWYTRQNVTITREAPPWASAGMDMPVIVYDPKPKSIALTAPTGSPLFNLSSSPILATTETVDDTLIPTSFHTDMEWWFRTTLGKDDSDVTQRHVCYYGTTNRLYMFDETFRLRANGTNYDITKPARYLATDVFDFICDGSTFYVYWNGVLWDSIAVSADWSGAAAVDLRVGSNSSTADWAGFIYSPVANGTP